MPSAASSRRSATTTSRSPGGRWPSSSSPSFSSSRRSSRCRSSSLGSSRDRPTRCHAYRRCERLRGHPVSFEAVGLRRLTPKGGARMVFHRNAKLGLAGRLALVQAIEGGMSMRAAAAAFSVSPATAHRWWHRWVRGGRSRRARALLVCLIAPADLAAARASSPRSCRSGSAPAAGRRAGGLAGARRQLADQLLDACANSVSNSSRVSSRPRQRAR
jgi:transposase-like protein